MAGRSSVESDPEAPEAGQAPHGEPGLFESLVPVAILVGLLASAVYLFGSDSSYGPNQIALLLAGGVGILIGLRHGWTWRELETGIVQGISLAMGAILILLVVGSLIGTWILAGIVPTMIHYGLQILGPGIFYPAACVICAFVSIATGSSWTTASTVGIALVGIATAQELHLGMTAGAILSGAYFGDKMSPLSDTTNLAPAMAGTDIFTHIRHMAWTTGPSILLAVSLFGLIGRFGARPDKAPDLGVMTATLEATFQIGPHLLIPPALVLIFVWRRMPAFPALFIGALVGGLFAVLFQQQTVLRFVGETELPRQVALLKGFWMALFQGYTSSSGNAAVDSLLSRGGMASMLPTVWLILSAMVFGAVMETTRMLEKIAATILGFVRGTGTLIAATLFTSLGSNIIASDQYISIVLPGRMFRAEYRRRGLAPENLSRALEDAGTLTSPLVPWNTCGAFMSQTLGVATFTYLPWCFFNLINPLVSALYGFTGWTITKLPAGPTGDEAA
jgi:NhaC family Na+:H+ antiporter